MANPQIRLGVNIDHAATLRKVRGNSTSYPDLLNLTQKIAEAGAHQITIHLREDRRHIQDNDLKVLSNHCPLPINLEMAVTPEMIRIASKYQPEWACFVPEKRAELTTEGGLAVRKNFRAIKSAIGKLSSKHISVSTFIAPELQEILASAQAGARAIELHTGAWVQLKGRAKREEWNRLKAAATAAQKLGLWVHAGHGLDWDHAAKIRQLPHLREVNIGHSLICYSLELGIKEAVKTMRTKLRR